MPVARAASQIRSSAWRSEVAGTIWSVASVRIGAMTAPSISAPRPDSRNGGEDRRAAGRAAGFDGHGLSP